MQAADGRFSRRSRLLKPDEFRRVFRENDRSIDPYFVVLARHNGLDHARLGLAISKRRHRKAVDRNRLKRLIRESFRNHSTLLKGLDLVVINRGTRLHSSHLYLNSLSHHWHQLARKCKTS